MAGSESLRIVVFCVLPQAYGLLASWAAERGHRLVLLVTSPAGSPERYGSGFGTLVQSIPASQDVLITTRMKRTAAPVVAALAPDLILSATFPHRIPPEVTTIPRYGALNLHPAPLPRGRGPNPMRLIYEGDLTVAGAVHRIEPEFDAGPVLGIQKRRLPDAVTAEMIFAAWGELLLAALNEAVPRAVAGDPGETQDEARSSYSVPFTEEERWLTWDEPALTIQRRAAALNMAGPFTRAHLDGEAVAVLDVRALPGPAPDVPAGTIISRSGEKAAVRASDGVVEVTVGDRVMGCWVG